MAEDESRLPRRLSAVLLADMKDYSALMSEDEAHAIADVDDVAAVFARVVPRHGGTFEITSGDRFFAVFESAVEAFEAALEIQRALRDAGPGGARPPAIRMGMHLGEVVRTPFGLMGESINVAARLEAIAAPGGIAVSDDLYRVVRNRSRGVTFRDLGLQTLKNIREPIRVYAVILEPDADAAGRATAPSAPADGGITRRTALLGVLGLAAAGVVLWQWSPPVRRWVQRWSAGPRIAREGPLILGVMDVRARGDVPRWMSDLTRDGLNTVLSKQPDLLVFSRQKIDFLRDKRGLTEIEAAEQLGITKMISATLTGTASNLALEVQIIDIGTGLIEASNETAGSEQQLIEMQNDAALDVMHSLKVPVDQELARLLSRRTNDRLDDYKLLTESMGGAGEPAPPASTEPHSSLPLPRVPGLAPRDAYADADEVAIQALLERYRGALEAENLAAIEALHVALPDPMREALRKYFENAEHLRVQFSKVDLLVEGDEALATFTRSDDFVDASSGLPVHLEVRVSNVIERQGGGWRILGIKRPG